MRLLTCGLALALALPGCETLDPPGEAEARAVYQDLVLEYGEPRSEAEAIALMNEAWRVVEARHEDQRGTIDGVLRGLPYGNVLAGAYGLYLMARGRSRKHLARAAASAVRGQLPSALRSLDAALGARHTADAEPAPRKAAGPAPATVTINPEGGTKG